MKIVTKPNRIKAAIAISGRGSNAHALIASARDQSYPVSYAVIITDRVTPFIDQIQSQLHDYPPVVCFEKRKLGHDGLEKSIDKILDQFSVRLLCLAGFMTILSTAFVSKRRGRILNIHPSLLPKYRGLHTHRRVLESGDQHHGCSVHLVTEGLDEGPVIAQRQVPVLPGDKEDDLAKRVLKEEHRLFPQAVADYVSSAAFMSLAPPSFSHLTSIQKNHEPKRNKP